MTSRAESDVLLYKSSLESALKEDRIGEIEDILKVIENIPMTVEILRTTLIGRTLNEVKKKYPNATSGTLAKSIILKWKESCSQESQSTSTDSKPSISTKIYTTSNSGNNNSSDGNDDQTSPRSGSGDIDIAAMLKRLPEARVKIIDLIAGHLKGDCDEDVAKFMAFCVEDAVHSLYDSEGDKKAAYKDKLKSLSFNLKQNESLRKSLIEGSIQPSDLVTMSANDLATEETRIARGKIAEEGFMERRSDMYEIKRGEIQASNGIDPNMGGEFTCKKCKSKKTTNYQMQTRSSDEPMTVFIRCLTCGNRWRF